MPPILRLPRSAVASAIIRPRQERHHSAFSPHRPIPPIYQEQLYGSALTMINVKQEPQAEPLSMDGDGTLLADFAPARVVRWFETNRLSGLLDYGRQLVHRSVGSVYLSVHAADDTEAVQSTHLGGAPASSTCQLSAEEEGASSHGLVQSADGTHLRTYWEDDTTTPGIGASRTPSQPEEAHLDRAKAARCFLDGKRGVFFAL